MNFQDLICIEPYQKHLDVAFHQAKTRVDSKIKKIRGKDRISRKKNIEIERLKIAKDVLNQRLSKIVTVFPRINDLPKFYVELIKCTTEYGEIKKALAGINWAAKTVVDIFKKYEANIRKTQDIKTIERLKKEFFGRVSSVLKQIGKQMLFLEEARKIMKNYPSVKQNIKTIAIVGFPNVGKTTLLYKLTGSKPEINEYAFTTKGINVSYIKDKKGKRQVQLLDTPGTLDRFEKMNNIEKQAYLAIKYCAEELIYVFDITEPYPMKDQEKLLRKTKEEKKKVYIYLSKTDILKKEDVEKFKEKHQILDSKELKKKVLPKLSLSH